MFIKNKNIHKQSNAFSINFNFAHGFSFVLDMVEDVTHHEVGDNVRDATTNLKSDTPSSIPGIKWEWGYQRYED